MKGNLTTKLVLLLLLAANFTYAQGNARFRVVLDAGHGGKDYGAIYHGFIEKNIALSVALKVGKILEKDPSMQVLYTRKTDVFIELKDRPAIANKAEANIFVSIHCNGEAKKAAFGTETFVIGTTKNASNLEVAKKENFVIKLEKDYKTTYAGFDPNAPETLIGLMVQQEAFINQSIDLASKVQDNFTNVLDRKSRGVKQGPFWVLHRTAMPSILIELGFLSYKQEGEYLNSEKGQDDLAESIAKAITSYKKEYFVAGTNEYSQPAEVTPAEKPVAETKPKPEVVKPEPVKPKTEATAASGAIVFKVQISASSTNLETVASNFKGLSNISKDASTSIIKYFYGATADYSNAKELLAEAKGKGFDSAFVVAFKDGKKISVQEALAAKK
ncbi:MAG: N-acetylmuramoyl-L-alanine amidase family protein [Flavobacterium sp.]